MYGKIVDGELIEAPESIKRDIAAMKAQGYKPVIFSRPGYDVETQYCNCIGYDDTGMYIKHIFEVVDIEPSEAEIKLNESDLAMSILSINLSEQVQTLSDEDALKVQSLYPVWVVDTAYDEGYKVKYKDVLYKVLQAHTSQEGWTPDTAVSLFAKLLVGEINEETGEAEILEWVQPDSTNPYMTGDKVIFNEVIYESLIDYNVWSPSAFVDAWRVVEES